MKVDEAVGLQLPSNLLDIYNQSLSTEAPLWGFNKVTLSHSQSLSSQLNGLLKANL